MPQNLLVPGAEAGWAPFGKFSVLQTTSLLHQLGLVVARTSLRGCREEEGCIARYDIRKYQYEVCSCFPTTKSSKLRRCVLAWHAGTVTTCRFGKVHGYLMQPIIRASLTYCMLSNGRTKIYT